MNKKISFLLVCMLSLTLIGCNTTKAQNNVQNKQVAKQEQKVNEDKKLLEKILITYKVDSIENDKQTMQVIIKNTSDKTFTGDINIYFLDKQGKEIGSDMAIVENLKAGDTTLVNIKTKVIKEENIKIDYNFSDEFSFVDNDKTNKGTKETLDKELTEKISKSVKDSFEQTTWYLSIINISIYTEADNKYMVIKVTDNGEKIGNILFGNFAYGDTKINKVIVKDKDDNILFSKTK